jgi:hypothetical protein
MRSGNSRQEAQSSWLFLFKFLALGLGPMGATCLRCWGIGKAARAHNSTLHATEKHDTMYHADSGPCDKDVRGSCLCGGRREKAARREVELVVG